MTEPDQFDVGRVKVFDFIFGQGWAQVSNDIIGEEEDTRFGAGVVLSKNGNTVVVGGPLFNNSVGIVRAFELTTDAFDNQVWEQTGQALVGPAQDHWFGYSLAINDNATVLVVGGPGKFLFDAFESIVSTVQTFEMISPPTLAPIRNDLPTPPPSSSSSLATSSYTYILGICNGIRNWLSSSFKNLRGAARKQEMYQLASDEWDG